MTTWSSALINGYVQLIMLYSFCYNIKAYGLFIDFIGGIVDRHCLSFLIKPYPNILLCFFFQ